MGFMDHIFPCGCQMVNCGILFQHNYMLGLSMGGSDNWICGCLDANGYKRG